MSGPATGADDVVDVSTLAPPTTVDVELLDSREAKVGSLMVHRALPQRNRRTVGAWCFLDHAVPAEGGESGTGIGPHPHIGLQTVTWVLSGEFLHRDSLGSEQPIRPGELNLMTAGHGIVHAEERIGSTPTHIAQLWVAQPAATRKGAAAFEHHADLPKLELDQSVATVLVGELGGVGSPARRDTEHFGADLEVRGRVTIPLARTHEHVVVPLDGALEIDGRPVAPTRLAYLPTGRDEIALQAVAGARVLLLGGVPFDEAVVMWWNYVARTREEISDAHAAWTARTERFGLPNSNLSAIDVDPPPWTRP